jgi:hypothetical protein
MFEELKAAWLTDLYMSYKGILLPSLTNQLSKEGVFLDLDSLPLKPIPFKELFIRWLILINKDRIERNEGIFISRGIVLNCPLWRAIKCPMKSIKLTKESMFNKPNRPTGTIGTVGTIKTIGTTKTIGSINKG